MIKQQEQLKMNFKPKCIFNYFEIPNGNSWAFEMKAERDEKFKKDIMWLSRLLDKYSK